ncbi:MAG: hypothetical protein KDD55_09080, partial [Bdellovibrionales bacterium]|nr:hypothetical protein [Bdellovibrionales bacterium]
SLHSWIDAYTRFSSDSDERDGVGPTGVEHKAGWGTFNISAGLEIGKKRDVRIVADIINIFDKIYTPAQENLIAPGTAALVRVVVDLS